MIRDPSDGSVREKPETGIPASGIPEAAFLPGCHDPDSCHRHQACMYIQCRNFVRRPVIDPSISGLPVTTAKESYLARLEEYRKWLKRYVRPTIIEKGQ